MPAYFYLEVFPEQHDFLYGQSFPNPSGIFPFTPYKLAVEIHQVISPDIVNKGVIGSAASVYWVEMYANFGTLGVLFAPVFVGVWLYLITYIIDMLESTPLKIALTVWLALHLSHLSISFLSKYFFDIYLIGLVIFFLIITALSNKGKIKLNSKINRR